MNFKIIKIILGLLFFTLSMPAFSNNQTSESMNNATTKKFDLGIALYNSNDSQKVKKGVAILEEVSKDNPEALPYIWSYYVEQPDFQEKYPNLERIVYWSEKTQASNLPDNILNGSDILILALIYRFDEKEGYKDIEKSDMYFKKLYDIALKQEDDTYLMLMYMTGYGVEKDFDKAWNQFLKKDLVEDGKSEFMINETKKTYKEGLQTDEGEKKWWLGPKGTLESYFEFVKEAKELILS